MEHREVLACIIEGARVFPEMEEDGDGFIIPTINREYTFLTVWDGVPIVSKDCNEWVIPASVVYDNKERDPKELYEWASQPKEET